MIALLIALFVSVAISTVTAALFGPKPIYGAQLKNRAISSSTFGKAWPRCRGKVRLPGNMIWSTPIRQANRKTTSGGIFGLGEESVYTFRYSVTCAVGFGYKLGGGAGGSFLTIYADGKVLYTSKITDAGVGGTVTLVSDGGSTQYGSQNVDTAALGDQVITLQTGAGGSLDLSAGDMIQLTYYVVTEVDDNNDTQQVVWNAAPGLSGGTFASLGLSVEMNTQEYEVQAPITLGPNQSGQVQIFPALIDNYPAGATLTVPGLTTPLLDQSSFDPDPHDGSHAAAGGYYPKNGYITFYYGSATQDPDPLITAAKGAGNAPAYRGLAYVVISDLELSNYGNRIPNFSAEIDWESPQGNTDSTAGEVLGVEPTNRGIIPYIQPPAVVFTGDGTGAAGTAVLNSQGFLMTVDMTSNGHGYTFCNVAFNSVDGVGQGAAGVALLNPGSPTQPTTTAVVMLSDVVSSILTEAGYSASQYDVTALSTTAIQGIDLDQEAYRDSIQRLMGVYLFDSAEIDGQIVFSFRDGLPVLEIPESDLGVLADMTGNEPRIVEMTEDEQNVPFCVWLRYSDSLKQYQPAAQYAKRISQPYASTLLDALPVTNSRNTLTLDTPITDIGTTMKQQAEKILYDFWSSRETAKFKLPYKYAQLDPLDIVEIPYKDDFLVVRFTTINLGASFALECEGVAHDYHHSIALSDSGPGSGGSSKLPAAGAVGPSNMFLLDIPFLDDGDSHDLEDTGMYFALATLLNLASSSNTLSVDWHGGKVYRSVDQAPADFASVGTNSTPAFCGTATTLLPAPVNPVPSGFSSDTVTIAWTGYNADLKVGPSQPLTSSSDDGVTNSHENLAALIKTNGDIELFQFVNAMDNGDGTFTLSRLVRGVRGTETMAAGHAIGDAFVLLSGVSGLTDSTHFDVPLGDRNRTRYYQAVSDGATADYSSPTQKTTICRDLMPYAPYKIAQYADPLENLVISWVRRTRLGGNWADGTDGPLSEQYEEYQVDILGPGDVPLRTLTTPIATVIYTAAQQEADFGGNVSEVKCNVYQISAIVGRGFPGTNAAPSTPTWGGEPYAVSYDMGPGVSPVAGETIHEHLVAGNVTGVIFPIGLNDSVAGCRVAPSTNYQIVVNWKPSINGAPTQVATLTYMAGQTQGTFAFTAFMGGRDFPVMSGQVLEFVAPNSIDFTIAGIYFTASGKRYIGSPATIGVATGQPLE